LAFIIRKLILWFGLKGVSVFMALGQSFACHRDFVGVLVQHSAPNFHPCCLQLGGASLLTPTSLAKGKEHIFCYLIQQSAGSFQSHLRLTLLVSVTCAVCWWML